MTTQSFDASHSQSAFEAELANSAAKRSKTEHGVSIKKARNMDNHALTDSLSNVLLSSSTKQHRHNHQANCIIILIHQKCVKEDERMKIRIRKTML
jgi:hypothetical protein